MEQQNHNQTPKHWQQQHCPSAQRLQNTTELVKCQPINLVDQPLEQPRPCSRAPNTTGSEGWERLSGIFISRQCTTSIWIKQYLWIACIISQPLLLHIPEESPTKIYTPIQFRRSHLPLLLLITALVLPALACDLGKEEPAWVPENPKEYTAETTPVEVYVLIDEAGNVVDFESRYAYGVTASLRYELRFWDVGNRMDGYETATIYRVYTPLRVTGINADIEQGLSEAQRAEIYARTTFPSTEVKLHELTFSGGPEGTFIGTNSETGQPIYGHMDWREKEWEMHVVFTEDIQQDYLVLGEEPFYNWP